MKKLLRNLSVLCFVLAAFLTTGCYEEEVPFLNVDREVVLVGPQADKGTVVVESNLQWVAASEVAWITLDNGFGNHKGTFEFFVAANTTPNERSGKIVLTAKDYPDVKVTILVRQQSEGTILTLATDDVSFTKYAGDYLMSIACNGAWKVASSADWCTVDPTSGEGNGSFKISVDENNTGADRVAIISILTEADGKTEVHQIKVTQSASNAALVVSPESKTLTAAADEFELDVITVGSWEASLDSDWLTLSETEGTGDAQITVTATANDTGKERIAVITFATGAENENRVIRQIVVRQAAVDFYLEVPVTDYPLSLDEQTIEIPYVLEGSNVTVTASSSSKWMTVGTVADGVATVNVAENKTAIAREGVISFITHGQAGDPIIRQVRVAQAPTINVLEVLADEYAVEWVGATVRIPIQSNTPVSVRSSESWCTATDEGQEIVITAAENTTAVPRVAVVTVTTNSESGEILSRTIIVRQGAAYSELVVTPAEKNIYATAQSFVASIITNNSWTASSDSDWLTIDKAEGTGDFMLTVTAAKNETGQVRVATVTVQTGAENSQRESATIVVTQRPEQFYFEVPVRSFLVDKLGDTFKVAYVTSGSEQDVTASSSAHWLYVTEIKDGEVEVRVDENKTAEVRSGVVTITCTPVFGDPVSIPVTFTQSPTVNILDVFVDVIDVSAKGDEVALPYYANTPVSISSSEEWCHVEVARDPDSFSAGCCSYSDPQKIIKIEVDPNRTGEARVAYVTISTVNEAGEKITKVITVRQAALYAALSVSPKEVVIPAVMGHFNMVVNTTGTWMASTTCTWLQTEHIDDDGYVAGFGDDEVLWTAGDNITGAVREAEIVVATGGENNEREEQIVKVTQLERSTYIYVPEDAYALTKEEQTLRVGYYAAGDFKDMQVNTSADWITYHRRYSDDEHLGFSVEENTTAEPRTATVTVTLELVTGEPISDTFIVTQSPTINILDVYVDEYEASPNGEIIVFPFYGNSRVSTSVTSRWEGWCHVSNGLNQNAHPQELTVRVDRNESAEPRVAYVTLTVVTDKGEKLAHVITIHQNPLNADLIVSPETIILPAENAEFDLTIITTGTWEISYDCTWLEGGEGGGLMPPPYILDDVIKSRDLVVLEGEDGLSGTGDAVVSWRAGDNNTGAQREATIIVYTGTENEHRIAKEVKVIQLTFDTYVDVPQDAYLVPKEGFEGDSNADVFDVPCLFAGNFKDLVVSCSEPWIQFYKSGFNHLYFTIDENVTGEPRTATVTVSLDQVQGEPITDSFTVTQAGTYNMLEVFADFITVSPAGDSVVLPAITNVAQLGVNISEAWLKEESTVAEVLIPAEASDVNPNSNMATVTIVANPNDTGRDRLASVTVYTVTNTGETIAKMIRVFQAAETTHFAILSGENVFIPKNMDEPLEIVAYASVNPDKVQMISNSSWLTVESVGASSGEIIDPAPENLKPLSVRDVADADPAVDADDNGNIVTGVLKAEVNNTGEVRTAIVTVNFFDYDGKVVQKTVTVTQAANDGGPLEALLDYIVVQPEGEELDLTFETDEPLTSSYTAAWLEGTDFTAEQTDPQTLHIKAAANTTGRDRTAYITVSNGSQSKMITVFQPAAKTVFSVLSPDVINFDHHHHEYALSAYLSTGVGTEDEPKITFEPAADWIDMAEHRDPEITGEGTIFSQIMKLEKNDTGETRSAVVKVTAVGEDGTIYTDSILIVQASTEYVLEGMPEYIALDPAGESYTVSVVSEDRLKSAISSANWIEISSNFSNDAFTMTAQKNTTGKDRTAYVTVKNSKLTKVITVFQPAASTVFSILSAKNMAVSSGDVDEDDIYELAAYLSTGVVLNEEKRIVFQPAVDWISLDGNSVTETEQILTQNIVVDDNTTGKVRSGAVKVIAIKEDGTVLTDEIVITQSPSDNILDVYVSTMVVPHMASSELIPIYDNAESTYPRSSNSSRVAVSLVEQDGTKDIKMAINENTSGEVLVTYVTVSAEFEDGTVQEKVITVVQLPNTSGVVENYFVLASNEVTLPAGGGSEEIEVFTNAVDYTFEKDADWLTVSKGSVIVSADLNTGDDDRTATVTITATFADQSQKTATLKVTQGHAIAVVR
ncbi:MAG: hypothetical protein IKX71_08955 [Bacteroidales bacterium]|nr:hypothetical protein [Bacteroidales bacterium]